jgi:hypothetical protein
VGTKGAWSIAGAILLAAVLVVGAFAFFRHQDQTCAEWQAEYRATLRDMSEEGVALGLTEAELGARLRDKVNELVDSRPGGCTAPDVSL